MNEVMDTIRKRRSVRWYASRPVPRPVLDTLIEAGNLAPSGSNTQPWRFVVVQDEAFRKKMASLALPAYHRWMEKAPEALKNLRQDIDARHADPVYYSAPAVVFVIGRGMTSDFDCSMACENIMLAARSLGLGSCWVFFGQLALSDPEIRAALELAEGEKIYGPILLGYPQGDFPEGPEKKPPRVKWI